MDDRFFIPEDVDPMPTRHKHLNRSEKKEFKNLGIILAAAFPIGASIWWFFGDCLAWPFHTFLLFLILAFLIAGASTLMEDEKNRNWSRFFLHLTRWGSAAAAGLILTSPDSVSSVCPVWSDLNLLSPAPG